MERRTFMAMLTGGMVVAPLAAEAQQVGKVYRIGWLGSSSPASATHMSVFQNFHQGLRDLGYVEGRDFVIEYRFAEGQADRLPELAADLVRAHVDVIVTPSTPATLAAMQATKTIPIVSPTAGNLVATGIVKSLARPGGNVTGVTTQVETLKLYQLLKEAAPRVTRVVYLYDPASSRPRVAEQLTAEARAANVELQVVAMRDPNNIPQAFAEFPRGTNGLILDRSSRLLVKANEVCKLALQGKLPTVTRGRQHADAGCLMSYGENLDDMARRAATYVDKILKGAKPADLPVELPTKFELVINLKTAKALGLTIPQSLLGRADEVIQ